MFKMNVLYLSVDTEVAIGRQKYMFFTILQPIRVVINAQKTSNITFYVINNPQNNI